MPTLQTLCISGKLNYIEVFTLYQEWDRDLGSRMHGLHSLFGTWWIHHTNWNWQVLCENLGIILFPILWLIHTQWSRDQYMEQDWRNRKEWVLVPVPVSDQCEWTFLHTRMHSSRMHTVRCSGLLSCHTHPLVMHAPCHACPLPSTSPAMHPLPPLSPCTPPFAMHAPPPWTDRRLWKHYLSTTTVADGKYIRTHWSRFRSRSCTMDYTINPGAAL